MANSRENVAAAVYVGNRLGTDIRPARVIGHAHRVDAARRGAPAPTADQLDEPDAVITTLTGLPTVLVRLVRVNRSLTTAGH